MQFTIHNQTVIIDNHLTVVTIHHPVQLGGDQVHRFPFSILDRDAIQEIRRKDFATYWWLGTLAMQIRQISTQAKQLQLFN